MDARATTHEKVPLMQQSTYKPKPSYIIAVQINKKFVERTNGQYKKWGFLQNFKEGDWLVRKISTNDTYTIENNAFMRLYAPVRDGLYKKKGIVLARKANNIEFVPTKENKSSCRIGDYIVTLPSDGSSWVVPPKEFENTYMSEDSDETEEQNEYVENMSKRAAIAKKNALIFQTIYWILTFILFIANAIILIVLFRGDTVTFAVAITSLSLLLLMLIMTILSSKATQKSSIYFQLDREISNFKEKKLEYSGDNAFDIFYDRCNNAIKYTVNVKT